MADTSLAQTASGRRRAKSTRAQTDGGTSQSRPARELAASRARRTARGTGDEWLTVEEVCAELMIGRRTFERWRTAARAPARERKRRQAGQGVAGTTDTLLVLSAAAWPCDQRRVAPRKCASHREPQERRNPRWNS